MPAPYPEPQSGDTITAKLRTFAKTLLLALGYELKRVRSPDDIAVPAGSKLFAAKFGEREIRKALDAVRIRWPEREVVALTQSPVCAPLAAMAHIVCGWDPVLRINAYAPRDTVFLYACDSDDLGLPYLREIVRCKGIFHPVQVHAPSTYANIDDIARQVVESEYSRQTLEGFAKFECGPGDALNLTQAIALTAAIAGEYVDIGCFRGSAACVALAFMRAYKMRRRCWFLDVFARLDAGPVPGGTGITRSRARATEGQREVSDRIRRCCAPEAGLDAIVLEHNIIAGDLPREIERIALANIGVESYAAVLAALERVAPRMAPGGIMIVEDAGHTPASIGSRLALHEFLHSPAAKGFVPICMESGQTLVIRIADYAGD